MRNIQLPEGVTLSATVSAATESVLAPEVVELIAALHRNFNQRRKELLQRRAQRQAELDAGKMPDFLPETDHVRKSDWTVASIPADLQDRRVEITGPTDRKMVIMRSTRVRKFSWLISRTPILRPGKT
jgi:malate synthase